MWKDILRRRWISTKNHPEFWFFKLAAAAGILSLSGLSVCICISALAIVMLVNLSRKEENYMLPFSDREHRIRRVEESIYLSGIYTGLLLLHNLIFLFVLQDAFYVEQAGYLLLFNVFCFLFGIDAGINIGTASTIAVSKEDFSVDVKGDYDRRFRIWSGFTSAVGGMVLVQALDLFLLHGFLKNTFQFFFLAPIWYWGALMMLLVVEGINIVRGYRMLRLQDYALVVAEQKKKAAV